MNTPATQKEVHLISRPQGVPTLENFEVVETEVAAPGTGEILVRNLWLSVDPYMRGRMNQSESYVPPFELGKPMEGGCVGEVIESKNEKFSVGDYVLGDQGWRECWTSDGEGISKIDTKFAEPKNYLSILGLTGMTAWVGLKEIGFFATSCGWDMIADSPVRERPTRLPPGTRHGFAKSSTAMPTAPASRNACKQAFGPCPMPETIHRQVPASAPRRALLRVSSL